MEIANDYGPKYDKMKQHAMRKAARSGAVWWCTLPCHLLPGTGPHHAAELHQSAGNKQLAKTRSFNFPHKVIFFVEPSTLIGSQMNIFPLKNNVIADTPY